MSGISSHIGVQQTNARDGFSLFRESQREIIRNITCGEADPTNLRNNLTVFNMYLRQQNGYELWPNVRPSDPECEDGDECLHLYHVVATAIT